MKSFCWEYRAGLYQSFGGAKQVWPIHVQVAHPSLAFATLLNSRFIAGRSGGPAAGGGGGGGAGKDGEDDVTKLIDKYGDAVGQLSFSGVLGFASG